MLYKTIVLRMLEDRPQLQIPLQKYRQLLPTVEFYAKELKTSHEAWHKQLSGTRPGSNPSQIASEALELAISELEARLPAESRIGDEQLSPDETMSQPVPSSSD